MKTVTLEAFEDENLGERGLGVVGMRRNEDTNAAVNGLMIAHDLIEHVNGVGEIGSIDDELEALGAIWFVRGQFNDLSRSGVGSRFTVHENIAGDVVRMFADFFHGAYVNTKPPRTQACVADDDFREIIRLALKQTRGEVQDLHRDTLSRSNQIAEREAEYMAVCLPRMRLGYRKAKRKYGSGLRANRLFWEVEQAVDAYAQRCDAGQSFRLTYGLDSEGSARATCEEQYDYE